MDKSDRSMRRTKALNKWPYHLINAQREILARKAEISDTWEQTLENLDGKEVHNLDEDIENEKKKLELEPEQANTTQNPPRESFTRSGGLAMMSPGMENRPSNIIRPVLLELEKSS